MNLRFKAPKFMRNMTSKCISKLATEEFGCDVHIQINEMEVGMRNKKLYTHMSVDADIDRRGIMKLVRSAI